MAVLRRRCNDSVNTEPNERHHKEQENAQWLRPELRRFTDAEGLVQPMPGNDLHEAALAIH